MLYRRSTAPGGRGALGSRNSSSFQEDIILVQVSYNFVMLYPILLAGDQITPKQPGTIAASYGIKEQLRLGKHSRSLTVSVLLHSTKACLVPSNELRNSSEAISLRFLIAFKMPSKFHGLTLTFISSSERLSMVTACMSPFHDCPSKFQTMWKWWGITSIIMLLFRLFKPCTQNGYHWQWRQHG